MNLRLILWTVGMAYATFLLARGTASSFGILLAAAFLGGAVGLASEACSPIGLSASKASAVFHCTFHCTEVPNRGISPENRCSLPKLSIRFQTGRYEAGSFRKPLLYPSELRGHCDVTPLCHVSLQRLESDELGRLVSPECPIAFAECYFGNA